MKPSQTPMPEHSTLSGRAEIWVTVKVGKSIVTAQSDLK